MITKINHNNHCLRGLAIHAKTILSPFTFSRLFQWEKKNGVRQKQVCIPRQCVEVDPNADEDTGMKLVMFAENLINKSHMRNYTSS